MLTKALKKLTCYQMTISRMKIRSISLLKNKICLMLWLIIALKKKNKKFFFSEQAQIQTVPEITN